MVVVLISFVILAGVAALIIVKQAWVLSLLWEDAIQVNLVASVERLVPRSALYSTVLALWEHLGEYQVVGARCGRRGLRIVVVGVQSDEAEELHLHFLDWLLVTGVVYPLLQLYHIVRLEGVFLTLHLEWADASGT
jgi:hypothetical protein